MRVTNVKRLEHASEMIIKAANLIDTAVERDGDFIRRIDLYYLRNVIKELMLESGSIKNIAKVLREDYGL